MTVSANPDPNVCPDCGATLTDDAGVCWICRHALSGDSAATDSITASVSPFSQTAPAAIAGRAGQFSLASLMLTITFVAVLLGLFVQLPGLAIVLAVLATPALIKTVLIGRRRKSAGEPLTPGSRALTFIAALCFVVAIVVAAGGAFFLACFGSALVSEASGIRISDETIIVALVIATVAALVVLVFGVRFFWRWKKR